MDEKPLRVKLHFEPSSYWWIEVPYLPPVGSHVMPFSFDEGECPFSWEHDEVVVEHHLYFVDRNLVCVSLSHSSNPVPIGDEIDEWMIRAGWTKGDADAWS